MAGWRHRDADQRNTAGRRNQLLCQALWCSPPHPIPPPPQLVSSSEVPVGTRMLRVFLAGAVPDTQGGRPLPLPTDWGTYGAFPAVALSSPLQVFLLDASVGCSTPPCPRAAPRAPILTIPADHMQGVSGLAQSFNLLAFSAYTLWIGSFHDEWTRVCSSPSALGTRSTVASPISMQSATGGFVSVAGS